MMRKGSNLFIDCGSESLALITRCNVNTAKNIKIPLNNPVPNSIVLIGPNTLSKSGFNVLNIKLKHNDISEMMSSFLAVIIKPPYLHTNMINYIL